MPHKLLLADDSVTIQRVIELTFADEDVQVIAVGDGKQAIARAEQERPDIILADIGMPERDGYEVAEFIKRSPDLRHIPVLLLTGAFEPIDEARARAVGCDGVLVKPFEPQLVINRVKDLISGRRDPVQIPQRLEPVERPAAATPPAPVQPAASPVVAPPSAAGSIEDYFDRLDAAFSTLDGNTPSTGGPLPDDRPGDLSRRFESSTEDQQKEPVFGGLADQLAGWDPEIAGDPTRPAPVMEEPRYVLPSAPSIQTERPRADSERPRFEPRPAAPTLAEAFAALLAAEQGRAFSPAAGQAPAVATTDDATLEEITRRVLDRMNDRVVRESVLDVAERLVREEIDRIKSAAR